LRSDMLGGSGKRWASAVARPMHFAAAMQLRLVVGVIALAACGPRGYRHETVGNAQIGGPGVALRSAGPHRVDWAIAVPRSMVLGWTIECGGQLVQGEAGETFDEYRARRIADLQRDHEQSKQAAATIAGGAGYVVAEVSLSSVIALPAEDVGATTYAGSVMIPGAAPGACAMTLAVPAGEDTSAVAGSFRVVREIDRAAERAAVAQARRARTVDVEQRAIEVRAVVEARLLARGVDPEALRRKEAAWADARMRAEAQANARAELEARAAAERYAAMARREAAVREARARVVAQLVARGVREITPLPAPIAEDAGSPPVEGAWWADGEWMWRRGQWAWRAGTWVLPSEEVVVDNDDDDEAEPVETKRPEARERRDAKSEPTREQVRDHRDEEESESRPRTRDHR